MSWKRLKAEWQKDPEVQAAFDAQYPYEAAARSIADVRVEHGLTQAELAERIGTSQSVIARAESGRHNVNISLFIRIAQALGTTWEPAFGTVREQVDQPAVTTRVARGVTITDLQSALETSIQLAIAARAADSRWRLAHNATFAKVTNAMVHVAGNGVIIVEGGSQYLARAEQSQVTGGNGEKDGPFAGNRQPALALSA